MLNYVRIPVPEMLDVMKISRAERIMHYMREYLKCAMVTYWEDTLGHESSEKTFKFKNEKERILWEESIKILKKDSLSRMTMKNKKKTLQVGNT